MKARFGIAIPHYLDQMIRLSILWPRLSSGRARQRPIFPAWHVVLKATLSKWGKWVVLVATPLAMTALPAIASEWHGVGPDPAEKVIEAVEKPCRDLSLAELGIFRYTCNSARLRAQETENWQAVLRAAYYIGGGDVHSPATNKLFHDYTENYYGAFTACGVDWSVAQLPPVHQLESCILSHWQTWSPFK